jgi:hypothetical protein
MVEDRNCERLELATVSGGEATSHALGNRKPTLLRYTLLAHGDDEDQLVAGGLALAGAAPPDFGVLRYPFAVSLVMLKTTIS